MKDNISKKIIGVAVVATGALASPALAQSDLNQIFLLQSEDQELALVITAHVELNLNSWLRRYAYSRGLEVVQIEGPLVRIQKVVPKVNVMVSLARELRSILGSEARVRVIQKDEMALAAQAGGRPGRDGI